LPKPLKQGNFKNSFTLIHYYIFPGLSILTLFYFLASFFKTFLIISNVFQLFGLLFPPKVTDFALFARDISPSYLLANGKNPTVRKMKQFSALKGSSLFAFPLKGL